jgi:OOP family OmpA-OmpF porin
VKFGFDRRDLSAEAKALDAFAARSRREQERLCRDQATPITWLAGLQPHLGQARAETVMRYLTMQHSFPLHRMNVISYGSAKPMADNATKAGRANNRRVGLVVLM